MNWEMTGQRASEALLNGSYQGMLLIVATGLILKVLPRTNAATRHAVMLVTLIIAAAMPLLHFVVPASPAASVLSLRAVSTRLAPQTAAASGTIPGGNHPETVTERYRAFVPELELSEMALNPAELIVASKIFSPVAPIRPDDISSGKSFHTDIVPSASRADGPLLNLSQERQETRRKTVPRWSPFSLPGTSGISMLVMGLLLLSAVWNLFRLALQYARLCRLKSRAAPASHEAVSVFNKLKAELKVGREARLLTDETISSPVALGFRHPAVILPEEIEAAATTEELEQLLRHELAHLRRLDDWSNLVQQTIKACYWYHPGVRWLSHRLTVEREIACDDQVLSANETRTTYAMFLAEFASRRTSREWAVAQSAWSNKSQLKERIDMILNSKRNAEPAAARLRTFASGSLAALLAAAALHSAPRIALAEQPAATEAETTITDETSAAKSEELTEAEENASVRIESDDEANTVEINSGEAEDVFIIKRPGGEERVERTFNSRKDQLELHPPGAEATVRQILPAEPVSAQNPVSPSEGDAMEKRMERLEQMMGRLMERESIERKEKDVVMSFRAQPGSKVATTRKVSPPANPGLLSDEIKRRYGIDHSLKEMEKQRSAIEESTRLAMKLQHDVFAQRHQIHAAEKEALREQHRMLAKQMQEIEKRMKALEAEEKKKTEEKKKETNQGNPSREQAPENSASGKF
ncbi:MAG: M56 family metallopeptidase [Verrucomicrobiales bacterium]